MRLKFLDANNEVIGTLAVEDGRASATGAGKEAARIAVGAGGKQLFPRDGDAWLRAVVDAHRHGYCRAVVDEDRE